MIYRPVIAMLASLGIGAGGLRRLRRLRRVRDSGDAFRPPRRRLASAHSLGRTPASTAIEVDVGLKLSDPSGALALERAVSDPKSPSYRHFLTPASGRSASLPEGERRRCQELPPRAGPLCRGRLSGQDDR